MFFNSSTVVGFPNALFFFFLAMRRLCHADIFFLVFAC